METGFRGTFVIAWHQTQVDGQRATDPQMLITGALWRWHGRAMRIDGMGDVLALAPPPADMEMHQRAAQRVRQVLGAVIDNPHGRSHVLDHTPPGIEQDHLGGDIVLNDGQDDYELSLVYAPGSGLPLLVAQNSLPPTDVDLRVVRSTPAVFSQSPQQQGQGGVICFTPGTRLLTPYGPVAVEHLSEGDRVLTRDDGVQDIRWVGRRRMTGARLFAMPDLRPIRVRAGAIADRKPQEDLIVSPEHRLLLRGARARALFNTDEVLVAARDLVNDQSISVLRGVKEVTYIHLAFDQHQIVWANGMEAETFHPASCDPAMLVDTDRNTLYQHFPEVVADPMAYGDYARRQLTKGEAAIFRTDMGIPA